MSCCPCGATNLKRKPLVFQACCGRYIDEHEPSLFQGGAVVLMRSRYSAFVLRRTEYLLGTWHSTTRPQELLLDASDRWLGLDVRSHQQNDVSATVDFVARYREASGRAVRLAEVSRFVFEANRWWYVDGALII